ncbi:MAG: hypothetical protein HY553_05115 [Elusimicrobia bacterium]|nr:hypothetical protein [Elusimicrobiota bacterium]
MPLTVNDEEEARQRRKLAWLGVGALALIGAGAGVALWMRAPDAASGSVPFPTAKLVMPQTEDSPSELEKELGFTRLMEILGMESQRPAVAAVARPFVRAFNERPELKRTYEDFKKRAKLGQKPTAKEFMASLRSQPAFGRLTGEFGRGGGGGGGSSAMLALAQHPELKRFLGEQARVVGAEGGGAARDKKGVLAKSPASAGQGAASGSGSGSGAGSAAKGPGGFSAAELAQLASVGPSVAAGGETGTQSSPGNAPSGSGSDAHDATKLDKEWKDEKNITLSEDVKKLNKVLKQYPCLAPLGEAKLLRFINGADIDRVGVWGACFQLKWYQECHATNCTPPLGEFPCWQACLDANQDNERACIQKVRSQPGCSQTDIPPQIWEANCVPRRNPQTGKCLARTPPITECGLGQCVDQAPAAALLPTPSPAAPQEVPADPIEFALMMETAGCGSGDAACAQRFVDSFNDPNSPNFGRNYNLDEDGNPVYRDAQDWFRRTVDENPERAKELLEKYPQILKKYPEFRNVE